MEGTFCGVENGIAITILALCFVLFTLFIIIFVLWRREVNRRKNGSKRLLKDIKSSFAKEIVSAVKDLIKILETVPTITDFRRGEYSMKLKNIISMLYMKEGFLENIESLRKCIDSLLLEINDLEESGEKRAICVIVGIVSEMKSLLANYNVKNIDDAVYFERNRIKHIEDLKLAIKEFQGLVANKHSDEPENEMSSEE